MRMFLETEPGTGDYQQVAPAMRAFVTPSYVEIELTKISPTRVQFYNVAYLSPRDDTSWWVLACLGDAYDTLARELTKAPEPVRYALTKGIAESWPRSHQGLVNGFNGRFSPYAVIALEDPDNVSPRWFAAGVRGNVVVSDVNQLMDQRTGALIDTVIDAATALAIEVSNNRLDRMKVGLRSFGRSVGQDTKAQAKWLQENFSSVVKLIDKLPT